jgi:predicted GH43/DUF377 family glycosyl hydrolase
MIKINRLNTILKANPKRVILLYNSLGLETYATKSRAQGLIKRILNLTNQQVETIYKEVLINFKHRHRQLEQIFLNHFDRVKVLIPKHYKVSETLKLLIGAYFTKEYAIEAAALFNPSMMVFNHDELLEKEGEQIVISLRSVGEGHISSISFLSGVLDRNGQISLTNATPKFAVNSEKTSQKIYLKTVYKKRTQKIEKFNQGIFDELPESFVQQDYDDLNQKGVFEKYDKITQQILFEIIDTNYDVVFDAAIPISERIIFPNAKGESMGIEDVRFVAFTNDDGSTEYIGTYTAYNGHKISPQLIITKDFRYFKLRTMYGKAVSDKGFALFPEKIEGKYVMTARQGGENLTMMYSNDLFNWDSFKVIMTPEFDWGLLQQGNCGSPIKTKEGWLLITHAVGPMRRYVMSALLLDLKNPEKIIARLDKPLLEPNEHEREGYVPNVVYSCGVILQGDMLIIPYAMSDSASSFVNLSLTELLNEMIPN